MLPPVELRFLPRAKQKGRRTGNAGVTASVDTVSLNTHHAELRRDQFRYSLLSYGLNLIFLVVTSAVIGNPSWILSFSISPWPSSAQ